MHPGRGTASCSLPDFTYALSAALTSVLVTVITHQSRKPRRTHNLISVIHVLRLSFGCVLQW